MIEAKIISIDDKVMVSWHNLSEPNPDDYITGYDYEHEEYVWDDLRYKSDREAYEASETIAEVENVIEGYNLIIIEGITYPTYLNNKCFIEPTTPGKAKIVKI